MIFNSLQIYSQQVTSIKRIGDSAAEFAIPSCHCGEIYALKHSWTNLNPGRRFFGCRKYGMKYGFFMWLGSPVSNHSKQVIVELLSKVRLYEAEMKRAKKKEVQWRFICVIVIILCIVDLF
ncbi:hypothetical protein MANES_13G089160v8 [Manihot esculenta]|uniref:Uncharacterized protein n=1 Tax=Manihot esculenta TaxID=3983 RepID=A0ACB7GMJ3_MANES|nr:hypothetical protein MANES_13G089160v8 [Manihot esculenta]